MTDPSAVPPPDRELMLAAAPPSSRDALRTLFELDDRLAGIVRTTREPMVGQMRLAWWHDALERLDTMPPPAEPLLQDVARLLLPRGVSGAAIAAMTDGWEELVVTDPLNGDALARHADSRGGTLFALAGRLLGAEPAVLRIAGQGWAYADLARHLTAAGLADRASSEARAALSQAFTATWPAPARAVGVLALLARLDLEGGTPLAKAWRVARFRFTGR
ncbi:squalene/phytoene synthase family protein [Sphingomonas sp. S6]|jgi:phytoene synthase|uniref:squalene/phytoene synthase family protein n=1 Tax=Sphingomonas sp. S6 TaxID=3368600 RepID=UPI000FAEE4C2|nr:squalene/phytoene synthase family protein [uncultured Sphingomonas sp.]RTL14303.1 MAG: hypothetical protein EKK50_15965 [Sphingomonadaceae bacterium]